jgi:hypothetical protein
VIFNPRATITIDEVHGLKCLLIDDAFLNPGDLRDYAKIALQRTGPNLAWPWSYQILPADVNQKLPNYKEELGSLIEKHIGKNVCEFFGIEDSDVTLQAYKGPYFNCFGLEPPDFAPHVDLGHVSTFAYLNPPETCAGGTRLYRHIPTNTINVVSRDRNTLKTMLKTPLDKPLVESTEEWEMIEFFEMKYNRLIAFNSSSIHKPDLSGGNFTMEFDSARLTLNCFFRYLNAQGKPASRVPVENPVFLGDAAD